MTVCCTSHCKDRDCHVPRSNAKAAEQMLPISSPGSVISSFFSLQCDCSDSTVSCYITVVENKTWPPVFTDEIMTPENSFLALLVFPQLLIFHFFRNFHGVNAFFCASPVVAIQWDLGCTIICSVATFAPGAAHICRVIRISHLHSYSKSCTGCVLKC